MIGEIRQNFTEASALVGLILATALPPLFLCGLEEIIKKGEETSFLSGARVWLNIGK